MILLALAVIAAGTLLSVPAIRTLRKLQGVR